MKEVIPKMGGSQSHPRASIHVSHFNRQDGAMCRTFSQRCDGICFQTAARFEAGAIVQVRSCRREGEGACDAPPPPINTLGVVTRCRSLPEADPAGYEVNVRFFLPEW